MIIIVPTSAALTAQAQRIKELHEEKDGMRVRIVPADELYNEFSRGTPDANARVWTSRTGKPLRGKVPQFH